MKTLQIIFAGLMSVTILLLTANVSSAQLVRDKLPLLTYAEKAVPVYDEPNGTKKGRIPAGTSLVMVKIIRDDGWAYGSYKRGNKKRRINRWFRMSDLQGYLEFENSTDRAVSDTDAYRTRTSSRLVGRVASDEEITIVAKRGEKWKIIFYSDGGKYRMGWVDKTIFERNEEQYSYDENSFEYAQSADINGEYNNDENVTDEYNNDENVDGEYNEGENVTDEYNENENVTDEYNNDESVDDEYNENEDNTSDNDSGNVNIENSADETSDNADVIAKKNDRIKKADEDEEDISANLNSEKQDSRKKHSRKKRSRNRASRNRDSSNMDSENNYSDNAAVKKDVDNDSASSNEEW